MPKIIECDKDESGTFVPKAIRESRQSLPPIKHVVIQRQRSNDKNDKIEDFMIGVDAGLQIFEHIIERLNRMTRSKL